MIDVMEDREERQLNLELLPPQPSRKRDNEKEEKDHWKCLAHWNGPNNDLIKVFFETSI